MTASTTGPSATRSLTPAEERFRDAVVAHLRDQPATVRRAGDEEVRAHLLERPPTATTAELEAGLGTPVDYARALRQERGLRPDPQDWRARWRARPRRQHVLASLLAATLVVGIAAAGVVGVRWSTWRADVRADALLVRYDDDSRAGITESSTLDTDLTTVRYRPGGGLEVWVGLGSDPPVTVTRVALRAADLPSSLLRSTGVSRSTQPCCRPGRAIGFQSVRLRRDRPAPMVGLSFRFAGCGVSAPGSGLLFDELDLTYRARHRTIHQRVELPSAIEVPEPTRQVCHAGAN